MVIIAAGYATCAKMTNFAVANTVIHHFPLRSVLEFSAQYTEDLMQHCRREIKKHVNVKSSLMLEVNSQLSQIHLCSVTELTLHPRSGRQNNLIL